MDPEIEVEDDEPVADAEEGVTSQAEGADAGGHADPAAETTEASASDDDGDGFTISIGDEPPAQPQDDATAPDWVRELRKNQQKLIRENRELKSKLDAKTAPPAIVVGDRPTLEGCQFDEEKFVQALDEWHERKLKASDQEKQQKDALAAAEKKQNDLLAAYRKAATALPVKDFDDAEAAVLGDLDTVQQNLLLRAKDHEKLVYALGKDDKQRARMAAIKDYADFAIEVGRLESKLKVTPRKNIPQPERRISGSAPGKAIADAELAKLEADAARTGDRTKVAAYYRRKALAAQAA
jgi:hypothetical protein